MGFEGIHQTKREARNQGAGARLPSPLPCVVDTFVGPSPLTLDPVNIMIQLDEAWSPFADQPTSHTQEITATPDGPPIPSAFWYSFSAAACAADGMGTCVRGCNAFGAVCITDDPMQLTFPHAQFLVTTLISRPLTEIIRSYSSREQSKVQQFRKFYEIRIFCVTNATVGATLKQRRCVFSRQVSNARRLCISKWSARPRLTHSQGLYTDYVTRGGEKENLQ